ncbi:hypothetical protein B484DRAFT_411778 [Ochromonadaceae sp. CCMP2298]|nr:hypothetical protein B484DRAFT_411778 [Ochromonadaceae sp. CCMP2298]
MSVLRVGNGGDRYRNIGNVAGYTVAGFDNEGKTILTPRVTNTHANLAADTPGGHTNTHHVFVSVSAQSEVDPGQDAYDGRTYLFTEGGLAIPPHISILELLEAGRLRADQDLRVERRRLQVEADRGSGNSSDGSSQSRSDSDGEMEEGGGETQVVMNVDEDDEEVRRNSYLNDRLAARDAQRLNAADQRAILADQVEEDIQTVTAQLAGATED